MTSQEEYDRIIKELTKTTTLETIGDFFEFEEDLRRSVRIFDWDKNFDYDRYGKDEIRRCTGKQGYSYYITESQIWKDKRLIRIMIDDFCCRHCGLKKSEGILEVDHKTISYCKIPYESVVYDLTTHCRACHESLTDASRIQKYEKSPITVEPYSSQPRIGVTRNERSTEIELQAHRGIPTHRPQWTTRRSPQQLLEADERDQRQEEEDGSRS